MLTNSVVWRENLTKFMGCHYLVSLLFNSLLKAFECIPLVFFSLSPPPTPSFLPFSSLTTSFILFIFFHVWTLHMDKFNHDIVLCLFSDGTLVNSISSFNVRFLTVEKVYWIWFSSFHVSWHGKELKNYRYAYYIYTATDSHFDNNFTGYWQFYRFLLNKKTLI